MTKLLGIPMGTLAVLLLGVLAIALGAVAVLALRNRVFFRLGVRSVRRRPGRSALIVAGLMLGTAIIAAALATGDTMGRTIRSSAVTALGQTDELVSAKGAQVTGLNAAAGTASGVRYFPQSYLTRIERAVAGSSLVDGVAPAIIEPVAVQDSSTRQNEPRVTLFAGDSRHLKGFGAITSTRGETVSLADLAPGEAYLNAKAADKLGAHAGDVVRAFAGRSVATLRVKAIVRYDGTGTDQSALLLPLAPAQRLLGEQGRIKDVLISNRGGSISGARLTDQVVRLLQPTLAPLGLQANKTKEDALKLADATGAAFMSFFTTFGSFSIAAGILLIFLIFVMLAAERRAELGIARAIGTQRRHLVQMFLFEGIAYSLLAAVVGVLVGVGVAYGMVLVMAGAFSATSDIHIAYSVSARSILVAYAIGVLLTFVVVGVSAWRVSRMNIVTAIRNLQEPPTEKRGRRRWLPAIAGLLLGLLLVAQGMNGQSAVPLALGASIVILSLTSLARLAGLRERTARTAAGLALVAWNVLPTGRWLLGNPKSDFSIFVVSGLMIVIGATWAIMYNADVLLAG
jgi:putative ABC transport system permease protein